MKGYAATPRRPGCRVFRVRNGAVRLERRSETRSAEHPFPARRFRRTESIPSPGSSGCGCESEVSLRVVHTLGYEFLRRALRHRAYASGASRMTPCSRRMGEMIRPADLLAAAPRACASSRPSAGRCGCSSSSSGSRDPSRRPHGHGRSRARPHGQGDPGGRGG